MSTDPVRDESGDGLSWFRVTRKVTTEEHIFVRTKTRTAAGEAVRAGEYDHGPYNPRHVKETISSVSGPIDFDPKEYDS